MTRRRLATSKGGVPPCTDYRWERWCEPIRLFVEGFEPTWEELIEFGREVLGVSEDVLKQRVAWLEGQGKVATFPTRVVPAISTTLEEEEEWKWGRRR